MSGAYCFINTSSCLKIEPEHDKTNKMTCAPSDDSDRPGHLRPGHLPSLIIVFVVRFMGS